ncbi:MAG: hypothetical protein KF756_10645 [Acidobacteria bacterium]|nr:hypothetical protein [Acidobacteriota bacterium]
MLPQNKQIILPGSNHAVSFTDDTKPDGRKMRRQIAVSAQLHKHNPIDWYYDLIKRCQKEPGELKITALKVFQLMPQANRRKLWDTLRLVQINISDPLPYERATDEIVKNTTDNKLSIERLRAKAAANDPVSKRMVELLNNQTAERMLLDAPSRRLESIMYFIDNPLATLPNANPMFTPPPPPMRIDVSKFKSSKSGAIVRSVTEFSAKSASAFSEALDITMSGSYHGRYHPINPVFTALRKSHAFDEGNESAIEIMEEERRRIVRRMRHFEYHIGDDHGLRPLEGRIESSKSYLIQAADIASRIASFLLETEGLFTIARSFEYVMYNGKRLYEERAFNISAEYKKMGY